MRKKILAILLLAVLAISSAYAVAHVYWSRSLTHQINVVGISALLVAPDWVAYQSQTPAIDLSSDNKVCITVLAENYYEIWLNTTWTSNAVGLNVIVTGQYLLHYWSSGGKTDLVGSAFNIPMNTLYTVTKASMMWGNPGSPVYLSGGALQLTFTFDSELVTTPGNYAVNLLFQMGFV